MDQFDLSRERDAAAGVTVDEAMEQLESGKEKTRDRAERLVKLDLAHFYDPQDGWVLLRQGSQYKELHRYALGKDLAGAKVEAEAAGQGFRKVKGGLYWNEEAQQLYVKGDAGYTLYSIHPLAEEK